MYLRGICTQASKRDDITYGCQIHGKAIASSSTLRGVLFFPGARHEGIDDLRTQGFFSLFLRAHSQRSTVRGLHHPAPEDTYVEKVVHAISLYMAIPCWPREHAALNTALTSSFSAIEPYITARVRV